MDPLISAFNGSTYITPCISRTCKQTTLFSADHGVSCYGIGLHSSKQCTFFFSYYLYSIFYSRNYIKVKAQYEMKLGKVVRYQIYPNIYIIYPPWSISNIVSDRCFFCQCVVKFCLGQKSLQRGSPRSCHVCAPIPSVLLFLFGQSVVGACHRL